MNLFGMLLPIDDTSFHGVSFHMFDKKAKGNMSDMRQLRSNKMTSNKAHKDGWLRDFDIFSVLISQSTQPETMFIR